MPVHAAEVVGHYVYRYDIDSWWWSEGVRDVYPDLPHDARLDELASRLDARDGDALRQALVRCVLEGKVFALTHRVVDAEGRPRTLTITGGSEWARTSAHEVRGTVLDLQTGVSAAARCTASLSLGTALASHAVIDQAKGALMLVYGLDDAGAFDLLRWSSMRLNVKLSTIAQHVVEDLRGVRPMSVSGREAFEAALGASNPATAPSSTRSGRVLTTVHDGVDPVVTVIGDADLRCAKDLFDASNRAWTVASERGGLVVDLERTTHLGPTAVRTLGAIVRHAIRNGVRVRVDLPAGDPHGWTRLLPPVATRGIPTRKGPARRRRSAPVPRRAW